MVKNKLPPTAYTHPIRMHRWQDANANARYRESSDFLTLNFINASPTMLRVSGLSNDLNTNNGAMLMCAVVIPDLVDVYICAAGPAPKRYVGR